MTQPAGRFLKTWPIGVDGDDAASDNDFGDVGDGPPGGCPSANLVPGARVNEAKTSVVNGALVFTEVELLR